MMNLDIHLEEKNQKLVHLKGEKKENNKHLFIDKHLYKITI